jgi:hypothetical protein
MNFIYSPKITLPSFFTAHCTTSNTRTATLYEIYQSIQFEGAEEFKTL